MSPFNLTISFTNLDEIIWFSTSDIKNNVSIFLLSFRFIPANWNSYSKSDAALKPLKIILDLYFLHKSVVSDVKEIRTAGRNTQGVRIIKLSGEEKVVSADKIDDNLVWWIK